MTLAVHRIGRINQRANLEGAHNGEEKSISFSSGLPEIQKQHVHIFHLHLPPSVPGRSTQVTLQTISWHPNLPKLVWSLSLSLFPFRYVDFMVWIQHYDRAPTYPSPLLKTSHRNNHNLLLYTISCLIFASHL